MKNTPEMKPSIALQFPSRNRHLLLPKMHANKVLNIQNCFCPVTPHITRCYCDILSCIKKTQILLNYAKWNFTHNKICISHLVKQMLENIFTFYVNLLEHFSKVRTNVYLYICDIIVLDWNVPWIIKLIVAIDYQSDTNCVHTRYPTFKMCYIYI